MTIKGGRNKNPGSKYNTGERNGKWKPWIPDRLTKTEILRLLKQDRLWPLPLEEDQEELLKKRKVGLSMWVS